MLLYKISDICSDTKKISAAYINSLKSLSFSTENFLLKLLDKGYMVMDADESKINMLKEAYKKSPELFPITFKAINKGVDYKKIIEKNYEFDKAQEYFYGLLKNIDLSPFDESANFMNFVRSNYSILKEKKLLNKSKAFNVFTYKNMIDRYNDKITYNWQKISYDEHMRFVLNGDKKGLQEELNKEN